MALAFHNDKVEKQQHSTKQDGNNASLERLLRFLIEAIKQTSKNELLQLQ
jgi:hypothetical protein